MTSVQTVNSATPLEHIFEILDRDGCIVIEGLLPENDFIRLRQEVMGALVGVPPCAGNFFGFSTKRMSGLIAKCPASHNIAIEPTICKVMDRYLLQSCRKYQLNLTQAIQIFPGEPAQILHTDDLMFPFEHPGTEAMINCMWAVDDFTADNGATHLVPGSHKWDATRKKQPYESVQGVMRAGSVLIYFGSLIHGGGANRTNMPRTGLVMSYALGWLKQAENSFLAIPQKLASTLDPNLQRLLGYFVHEPNLGCVDGKDPILVLQNEEGGNQRFEEYLSPDAQRVLEEHRSKQKKAA